MVRSEIGCECWSEAPCIPPGRWARGVVGSCKVTCVGRRGVVSGSQLVPIGNPLHREVMGNSVRVAGSVVKASGTPTRHVGLQQRARRFQASPTSKPSDIAIGDSTRANWRRKQVSSRGFSTSRRRRSRDLILQLRPRCPAGRATTMRAQATVLLLLACAAAGAAAARELQQAGLPPIDPKAPCDLKAEVTTCKLPDGTLYQRHGAGFCNCGDDTSKPVCGTDQQTCVVCGLGADAPAVAHACHLPRTWPRYNGRLPQPSCVHGSPPACCHLAVRRPAHRPCHLPPTPPTPMLNRACHASLCPSPPPAAT